MGMTNEKFITSMIHISRLVRENKEGTQVLEEHA